MGNTYRRDPVLMSEYTPTTEDARRDYSIEWSKDRGLSKRRSEQFDRWLAEHDRQVAERAWDAAEVPF